MSYHVCVYTLSFCFSKTQKSLVWSWQQLTNEAFTISLNVWTAHEKVDCRHLLFNFIHTKSNAAWFGVTGWVGVGGHFCRLFQLCAYIASEIVRLCYIFLNLKTNLLDRFACMTFFERLKIQYWLPDDSKSLWLITLKYCLKAANHSLYYSHSYTCMSSNLIPYIVIHAIISCFCSNMKKGKGKVQRVPQ